MKTLQNNFTTPDQSKRLLELGVPADSADCYINLWNNYPYGILSEDESYSDYKFAGYMNDSKVLPCWSVGRLIEIYHICVSPGCSFTFHVCFPNLMNEIMYKLVEANCNGWLKLEKLEE